LFIITYRKKATLVFHSPIKENDNDHSITTPETTFYLEKYSDSILEILILVLLNISFFLGNYVLLDIL